MSKINIFALGGLNEVGKNMYVVEENDELIILDAGSIFPEESSLGIDYIVGDINYLKENEKKIKALVITHGHEDHIGAVPYLVNYVIYAPNQAKELIELKLKDHNIVYNNIVVFDKDSKFKTKNFTIEFFTVNHSVPDSFGIAVTTSNGLIVTTGDFKFDLTPIGPKADFDKMIELSKRGVTLLVSDSTNALVPGFSLSEAVVDNTLNEIFSKTKLYILKVSEPIHGSNSPSLFIPLFLSTRLSSNFINSLSILGSASFSIFFIKFSSLLIIIFFPTISPIFEIF